MLFIAVLLMCCLQTQAIEFPCPELSSDYFITNGSSITFDLKQLVRDKVKDDFLRITVTLINERNYSKELGKYIVESDEWTGGEDLRISQNMRMTIANFRTKESRYKIELLLKTLSVEPDCVRFTAINDTHLCCSDSKSTKWDNCSQFDRLLRPSPPNCKDKKDENDNCHDDFVFGYSDDRRTGCISLNPEKSRDCISGGEECDRKRSERVPKKEWSSLC